MLTSNIQLHRGRCAPWRSAAYAARAARTWPWSRRHLRRPRRSWQQYSASDATDHMDTTYWMGRKLTKLAEDEPFILAATIAQVMVETEIDDIYAAEDSTQSGEGAKPEHSYSSR
eukprot:7428024-Pyramimonas_sp.AAC.1